MSIFQRWILTRGCFFNVENWDQKTWYLYPGWFFNGLIYFFKLMKTSTHVENWTKLQIIFVHISFSEIWSMRLIYIYCYVANFEFTGCMLPVIQIKCYDATHQIWNLKVNFPRKSNYIISSEITNCLAIHG